jgi:hypothetical protein
MERMRFHASARRLSGNAAARVDTAEFLPAEQLRQWHEQLDRCGLRATGSPAHERYIDVLIARLEQAVVSQVHTEPVPIRRWTPVRWSLDSAGQPIATSSYIPYSYLLNWGIPTVDKCDIGRMRREAIAFTQMLLDLGSVA